MAGCCSTAEWKVELLVVGWVELGQAAVAAEVEAKAVAVAAAVVVGLKGASAHQLG